MHRAARMLVSIAMGLLVALELLVLAHIIVTFFGFVTAGSWGHTLNAVLVRFVAPFGLSSIRTPFAGRLDVNAVVTLVLVLVAGWLVSSVRRLMTS